MVDNIPRDVHRASHESRHAKIQWPLVTLTPGVGGRLLSIGSAAGVALMGQAKGQYTFFSQLKWMPIIALCYGVSIWVHLALSGWLV